MKRMCFSNIVALLAVAFLASCGPEEVVIGEEGTWRIFVSTDEGNSEVALVDLPANAMVSGTGNLATPDNGSPGTGRVSRMIRFRDFLFLLVPDMHRIDVISLRSADNLRQIDTLDFSDLAWEPLDIDFGNATTGFIIFSNSDSVAVFDLTTLGEVAECTVCAFIAAGPEPSAITNVGNKMFVSNLDDNSVSIISTIDLAVRNKIVLPDPAPLFIKASPGSSNKVVVVISAGAGKLEQQEPKTECAANFINPENEQLTGRLPIFDSQREGINTFPYGLAISERDWAFVPTNNFVNRLDLRDKVTINKISQAQIREAVYNPNRDEIILLDRNTSVIRIHNATGGLITSYDMSIRPLLAAVPR